MRRTHRIMLIRQRNSIEERTRRRLRSLRQARGWTIDELSGRVNMGPSTISRLETGQRRLALDHLVILARALDTTIDLLLSDEDVEDIVIRPQRHAVNGITYWLLTSRDESSGQIVTKMRIPERKRPPEQKVHPGRDWFYVLEGAVLLRLGDRERLVEAGQAVSFDTMTPHSIAGDGGPAEILSILDHHGERAHLRG